MSRYVFFPLSNNFVAIYVSNSLVIARLLGRYLINNETAPIFLLDDDALPLAPSHPPLSLQLLFILSRSICIIFKFKYIAWPFHHITTYHELVYAYLFPSHSLVFSSTPFPRSAIVAYILRLPVSHIPCSINSSCSSRGRENNVKVDTIILPARGNAYPFLKGCLLSSRFS